MRKPKTKLYNNSVYLNDIKQEDTYLSDISRHRPNSLTKNFFWDKLHLQLRLPFIIKIEDLIVDTEWGLINYLKEEGSTSSENLSALLALYQTKKNKKMIDYEGFLKHPYWGSANGLKKMRSMPVVDVIKNSPIYKPIYHFILDLEAIEYPFLLFSRDISNLKHHPFLYEFKENIIHSEDIQFNLRSGVVISDSLSDDPQVLYIRPWNESQHIKFTNNILFFS